MTNTQFKKIKKQANRRKRIGNVYSAINKKIVMRLLLVAVGILVVCQVTMSSNLATKGARINELNRELEQLKKEKEELSLEISSLGSLSRIKKVASTELYMVEGQAFVDYLEPSQSLASR